MSSGYIDIKMEDTKDSVVSFVPGELQPPLQATADNIIDTRKQVSIPPRESSGDFGGSPAGTNDVLNDRLTFYISDPSGFLDYSESYIVTEFEANLRAAAGARYDGFIDEGGLHACIKSITLRCGSTVIERLEDYAKLYNALKFGTVDQDHINTVEFLTLDDHYDYKGLGSLNEAGVISERDTPVSVGNLTLSVGGTQITDSGASTYLSTIQPGDKVVISLTGGPQNAIATVVSVNSDTVFIVDRIIGAGIGPVVGTVHRINKINRAYESRSMRNLAVNNSDTAGQKLRASVKIMLKSLMQNKYIPLPMLPAPLELMIEFNPARLTLVKTAAALDDDIIVYKWKKPRFIASIVQLKPDIYNTWAQMWESDDGITMPYTTFRRFNFQLSSASNTLTAQANMASARNVISLLCFNATTESDVKAAVNVKSQSTFEKRGLVRYRYSSGAYKYPDYGDCQTDDFLATEAFQQAQLTFNHMHGTLFNTGIDRNDWVEGTYSFIGVVGAPVVTSYTARKFMLCAPLSKYNTHMCGVDLSRNPLQIDVEFTGGTQPAEGANAVNLKMFIEYDAVLSISRKNGVIVKS